MTLLNSIEDHRVALRRDMRERWPRLAEGDVAAVATRQELAARLEAVYGMGPAQAQRLIEAWAKGRNI